MKKILFGLLLVAALLIGLLPVLASAAGTPCYTVQGAAVSVGDTFTVPVAIGNNPGIISMRFAIHYDAAVLELVKVENAGLFAGYTTPAPTISSPYTLRWSDALASANNTAQGTVATLTFKALQHTSATVVSIVHTEARNVAGAKVTFANGTASVAVACKHTYGAWTEAGSGHQQICSVCADMKTADHTWDAGTVTKEASCKETGVMTYTCTACGASKTESISKTTDHKYGAWAKVNDTSHKHTCTVCAKEETANHTWNTGTVTKVANCKETGVVTYICTACGASKTENISKTTDHKYGAWAKVNDTAHKHTCTVCTKEETVNHSWNSGVVTKKATCKEEGIKTFTCTGCNTTKTEKIAKLTAHTYDNACDTDCNICGLTRTTKHRYNTAWTKDGGGHWHTCVECNEKKDYVAHIPGAEATETKAQTCTTCGYIIKAALGHKHSYATSWTTDDRGHWYACSGCEEKDSYAEHDFENACDKDCSICGCTRETEHTFEENWTTDATNHWHKCSGCGLKQDEAAHEPGSEATATTAQTCTICGYEIIPVLESEETTGSTTEPVVASGDVNENTAVLWWIIVIVVAAAGGVVAAVIVKKKKV